MSASFYRRISIILLLLDFILSSVLLGAAAFLYGGRFTLWMGVLTVMVMLTAVAAGLGMIATGRFNRTLEETLGRVAAGQLGLRLPVKTVDETGRTAQAFNEMSVNLDYMVARLSEDRRRLQTILSTMTDGVIMTDKNGTVILANPAAERFFGFKRDECPGCQLIALVHEHEIDDLLKKCIEEKKQQSMQFESRRKKQFFRIVAHPLMTDQLTGVLLIFQDLTEVHNLQAVRRDFIANVSHELKTPLASIKAITETLEDGALDDRAIAREFLGKIDGEVNAMIEMVNHLIELSRIEMGRAELKIEPVNLNGLIREAITRLIPLAERSRVSIASEPALGLPEVPGDRQMIAEVVTNILQNALKFTPSGGKIKVYTRQEGDNAVVSIADTGIGIGPDDLPHIFERFYKADKSRNTGGTGLGLSIARHIVQVHGGRIWVDSRLGEGTTFTFTLPLYPEAQKLVAS